MKMQSITKLKTMKNLFFALIVIVSLASCNDTKVVTVSTLDVDGCEVAYDLDVKGDIAIGDTLYHHNNVPCVVTNIR